MRNVAVSLMTRSVTSDPTKICPSHWLRIILQKQRLCDNGYSISDFKIKSISLLIGLIFFTFKLNQITEEHL